MLNLAPSRTRRAGRGAVRGTPTSTLMPEPPLTALEWEEWGNPVDARLRVHALLTPPRRTCGRR
ncbi:hypothetical protein QJS66_07285 [Kocuria rhizophila]|nr:hypothetical protein QJS66_07285 [Kocuria rhizophila]